VQLISPEFVKTEVCHGEMYVYILDSADGGEEISDESIEKTFVGTTKKPKAFHGVRFFVLRIKLVHTQRRATESRTFRGNTRNVEKTENICQLLSEIRLDFTISYDRRTERRRPYLRARYTAAELFLNDGKRLRNAV